MDKETLEKLVADQPKEIRGKGVLLFNGAVQAAQAYQAAATAANLRDWEAAQAAMAKFAEQLGVREDSDKPLATIADVLDYLKESGWKVTKTSLYRHQKEGKLLPRSEGTYALKDVEKYARTWLREISTGKRKRDRTDVLQCEVLELEREGRRIANQRQKIALDRELDRYVTKEQMEIELATRAGIIDAGLKHWVKSHAAEWIRFVGGDMNKVGEFIGRIGRELDEHINSYAAATDYDVIIDGMDEAVANELASENDLAPEEEQTDDPAETGDRLSLEVH